jgi:hypothetical protein
LKNLNSQRILSRLESLIADGRYLLNTIEPRFENEKNKRIGKPSGDYADEYLHLKFTTSSLHFIEMVVGNESIFYQNFNSIINGIAEHPIKKQIVILEALHTELKDIWYWTAQGLANAEVFTSMLEESEHLLERGFKIPAAVLAGCVLETHLKKLCEKSSIPLAVVKPSGGAINKKAEQLNQDLTSQGVFNKNDSKEITNYLGIRNSAAHGHNDEFTEEQVSIMQLGVSGIISRNPI